MQLSGGGGGYGQINSKPYLMRMVGGMLLLPDVPMSMSLEHARGRAAARLALWLRQTANPSGGSNLLAGYGVSKEGCASSSSGSGLSRPPAGSYAGAGHVLGGGGAGSSHSGAGHVLGGRGATAEVDDEVKVAGERTKAESDATLRKHAVVIDDGSDDDSAKPSAKRVKRGAEVKKAEVKVEAASSVSGPTLTWRKQLEGTDWAKVPGLLNALPPMPPADGSHSPPNKRVLRAFLLTPLASVRSVIVAKYPYREHEYATGLALSPGVPQYPFHTNVLFKALANDRALRFNGRYPPAADLTRWATHAGVLLLNASLQDEKAEKVWKLFLSIAISAVSASSVPVGFIFIGSEAKQLSRAVTGVSKECVVECTYPAFQHTKTFVDTPPFSEVDEKLKAHGAERIKWEVLLG